MKFTKITTNKSILRILFNEQKYKFLRVSVTMCYIEVNKSSKRDIKE